MTSDTVPMDGLQCLRLLAGASVGRVVYTVGALPAVRPIRYRLGGDGSVLLRAAAGSELVRAVAGALVAFEAGEIDDTDGAGWSVTVLGRADVAETAAPSEDLARTAPNRDEAPPARPSRDVVIRIRPELVNGQLLPPAPPTPRGGN